ncbi:AraC family transcriptional regulator [Marinobacter nanhaiticus D15-8W]|uniref:AraC family transcriptional regulator n=1 Tax=Marinobacter nanhaiticus D15-8W TaxID=626887 RepID=N6X0L0_9GAMM|nr:AraC family transcriptional regulator [Marinobacter nanhaiticus]ENO16977.1 AraC family transcriptional regulator [Marinobacter nanhaiticus D15-8W]BES72027.1 AraC family transcriptional regulator [Marinobacter nanhaiticus D15-8W]
MANLTVSGHFVRAALCGAELQQLDTSAMLRRAAISPELLRASGARVSSAQFSRLMQVIWQDMADEFMGMGPRRCRPGTFATMCALLNECSTLESVLIRAHQFSNLFDHPVCMRHEPRGKDRKQVALVLEVDGEIHDPKHFFRESILVIWHRLCSWLIGQAIALDEARFAYPYPPHGDEYRHIFHCPLTFEAERTELIFDARFLSAPVIRDRPEMKQFLKTSPADLLARPDEGHSYTGRIRGLIGRDFSRPVPDFEWIASELHVSPQTLRRRLKQENTSFQEIKDLLRRDLAIYHLGKKERAINDIAHLVGFTEPSTFHRAFKKWTGMTPGAWRESEAPRIQDGD